MATPDSNQKPNNENPVDVPGVGRSMSLVISLVAENQKLRQALEIECVQSRMKVSELQVLLEDKALENKHLSAELTAMQKRQSAGKSWETEEKDENGDAVSMGSANFETLLTSVRQLYTNELRTIVAHLEREKLARENLSSDLARQQLILSEIEQERDEIAAEAQRLRGSITTCEEEKKGLEELLSVTESAKQLCQSQLDELTANHSKLQDDFANLESRYDACSAEATALKSQLTTATDQLATVTQMDNELSVFKNRCEELERKAEAQEKALSEETARGGVDLFSSVSKCELLSVTVADLESRERALRDELERTRERLSETQKKEQLASETLRERTQENSELRDQLSKLSRTFHEAEIQLESLKSQVESGNEKLKIEIEKSKKESEKRETLEEEISSIAFLLTKQEALVLDLSLKLAQAQRTQEVTEHKMKDAESQKRALEDLFRVHSARVSKDRESLNKERQDFETRSKEIESDQKHQHETLETRSIALQKCESEFQTRLQQLEIREIQNSELLLHIDLKRKEQEDFQRKLEGQARQLIKYQEEIDKEKREFLDEKKSFEEVTKRTLDDLKTQSEDVKKMRASLQAEHTRIQEAAARCVLEKKEIETKAIALAKEQAALEVAKRNLIEGTKSLREHREAQMARGAQEERDRLEHERLALEREWQMFEEERDRLEEEKIQAKDTHAHWGNELSARQMELAVLRSHLDQQLEDLAEQKREHEGHVAAFEKKLKDFSAHSGVMSDARRKILSELGLLESAKIEFEQSMRQEKTLLEREKDEIKSAWQEIEEEIQKLRASS